MISAIAGMNRTLNSRRAGGERRAKRSSDVQRAPPTTCAKSRAHSQFPPMATTTNAIAAATTDKPRSGTIDAGGTGREGARSLSVASVVIGVLGGGGYT